MKAFVVVVRAPNKWGVGDVLTSLNMGMKDYASKTAGRLKYDSFACHATCHTELLLEGADKE